MLKKAVLILGLLALAGCKLHVIALKGGEVRSPTDAGTCLEQTSCFHDIADTSFGESFEAVPAPGYVFVKWYGAEGFQCRNADGHPTDGHTPASFRRSNASSISVP